MASNIWWEEAFDGSIPVFSVEIGTNVAGDPIYVGRARLNNGEVIPGMVAPHLGGCQILLPNGDEKIVNEYEVLVCRDCDNLTWRYSLTSDVIPCGAIVGGRIGKPQVELVYIARGRVPEMPDAIYGGALYKGRGVCVPFSNRKIQLNEYQILCDTYCV